MKKFRYIIMLLAVIGFTACDSDSIEGLQGTFSDITFCDFNNANVLPTTKLGKGVKSLNTQFTDAEGNTLSLSFGSKEWILGEGSFSPVTTVSNAGTYAGSINGAAINEGNIDVSFVDGTYFISGLVKTADGKQDLHRRRGRSRAKRLHHEHSDQRRSYYGLDYMANNQLP